MFEGTVTLRLTKRGDLVIDIPPHIYARLGFPHSFSWSEEDDKLLATPSRSRMSNRQIKKFKKRHGLT